MNLMEALTQFLTGLGFRTTVDYMPAQPDRACALYPQDLREPGDPFGSGVLFHFRGERGSDSAMLDALRACRELTGFEGRLADGCPHIARVEREFGPQSAGQDASSRPFYALNLRFFPCHTDVKE